MPDTNETEATNNESEVTTNVEDTEEVDSKVQPDSEGSDSTEETDDEDPIASLEKVFTTTREAQLRDQIRTEERAKLEQGATERQRLAQEYMQREEMKRAFDDSVKAMKGKFEAMEVYDADGERIQFDDRRFQEFVQPWQVYNSKKDNYATTAVYTGLADTIMKTLPEDAREEFAKRADKKPLDEYLKAYAELLAPHTEFARKNKDEVDLKVKAAEARGFTKGQKAPAGTPRGSVERPAERAGSQKIEVNSLSTAAKALLEGQINEEQYREFDSKFRNS